MQRVARQFGRDLHCHRNTVNRRINPSTSVFEAVQTFTQDEKRLLLSWLTRYGPFWEDVPLHGPDHWLECDNEIVTDTALGEAAYCSTVGIDRRLVGLTPSTWERTPIAVTMLNDAPTVIQVGKLLDSTRIRSCLERSGTAHHLMESTGECIYFPISTVEVLRECLPTFERPLVFSHSSCVHKESVAHVKLCHGMS